MVNLTYKLYNLPARVIACPAENLSVFHTEMIPVSREEHIFILQNHFEEKTNKQKQQIVKLKYIFLKFNITT